MRYPSPSEPDDRENITLEKSERILRPDGSVSDARYTPRVALPPPETYRKCSPSGRNSGNAWRASSALVTSVHGPLPDACTRRMPPALLTVVPKRMTPSRFHAPPPPKPTPSHNSCGGPPVAGTTFSLPSAKNPIDRLSGDQNGVRAPAVPGNG